VSDSEDNTNSPPVSPAAQEDTPTQEAAEAHLSRYRVMVAGEFDSSLKQWAGLTELGVQVSLVGLADEAVQKRLAVYPLAERHYCQSLEELEHEAYRRWPGADLVVLLGEPADSLEELLTPWMSEAAAASLQPHLPLVRVDDPALRFLRTGEQWAFYLLGRALGLGHQRAREYMEECCGHTNKNS
jgi:hypothetical protein